MKKTKILIGLEFVFGPILKDYELQDGTFSSGSTIVDKDEIANNLDKDINDLWITLYSNDNECPSGMKFDSTKEKELAPRLLSMINELINRLNTINDGSFEIVDMISDHLKSLI